MSGEPLGPGDLAEVIKTRTGNGVGRIVTVTEVRAWPSTDCICGDREAHGGIRIAEARHPPGAWWCIHCFRPISRRKDFETFLAAVGKPLTPAKTPEPEIA